jgi:hypothetical protein
MLRTTSKALIHLSEHYRSNWDQFGGKRRSSDFQDINLRANRRAGLIFEKIRYESGKKNI